MRLFRNLFICIALTLTWAARAWPAPPVVGDMGTVDRFDIVGARFATPERLQDSLSKDLEFLLAAEPAAALEPLLNTACRRLEAGYRRAGFADVTVVAHPDLQARRVRLIVQEGSRYVAKGVRVAGQSRVTAVDLARWLAAPHPVLHDEARIVWQPAEGTVIIDDVGEEPIWSPGKPARFNNWSREQLRRQVYLAFAEFGFFFPKLKVEIVPHPDRGEAELVIEVEDEGPPGIVGPVEVLGAERHPPDAILRYLELAPGQPLNRGRLAALQTRLYDSARFVFVAAVPVLPADGEPRLRLKLIEVADGPLLGEPFSAEEQAMLRLRGWLMEQINTGREDLVLSLRDASLGTRTVQAVVSARGVFLRADVSDPSRALTKGVLFKLRSLAGAAPPKEEPLHCLAGVEMTAQQVTLYSPMRDRLFATTPGEKQLALQLKLRPDPRQQRKLSVSVDPDVRRVEPGKPVKPVAVDLDLAPAAFLILAHLPAAPCQVEQVVLRIKTKTLLLESDAATGRLLKTSVHDAKNEQEATLSAGARRLEGSIAEMRRIAEGDRNDHDPRRSLTSLSAFGICELAHLWRAWEGVALAGDRRGFDVWQELLASYLLPDLDKDTEPADGDSYVIPAEPLAPDRLPRSDNGLTLAAETLFTCREVFPAESWPCRLARAAVLYYANDDRGAQRELLRIDSATTGPAGHLVAALLAGMIEPSLVNRFATAGLQKLTIADFRRDYSLLLESRSPAVASAFAGIDRLSKLDPAQAQAAVSVLPKPLASFIGDLIARQRTLPDAPLDVVLAGLLDDYWSGGLEVQARFVLRWLADSSAPATAKTRQKTKFR